MKIEDLAQVELWTPNHLECPLGLLIGASCPGKPPDAVMTEFRASEILHAATLDPSRRREWLAGRLCLRTALESCSTGDVDLLPLPSGAPYVPAGVTGSISHKRSLALALVYPGPTPCGVDIEEIEERDEALVRRIMTPRERTRDVSASVATIYFSAKEAIYKLLPAEMQPEVDFEDIELERTQENGGWAEFNGLVGGTLSVCVHTRVTEKWSLAVATRLLDRDVALEES